MSSIHALLYPRRVAVVGSVSPGKLGAVLTERILDKGFKNVCCVNPKAMGWGAAKGYASIADCPEPIDMVVIASPAATVAATLREAGQGGVKAAAIISSGFSEAGRAELEAEIMAVAKEYGIRYIGPNCAGLVNTAWGLEATLEASPAKGRVSLISQSGAIGGAFMEASRSRGLGVGKFLSFGNGSDLNQNELLEYLADDPDTAVIAMYIENVKEGRPFMKALAYAAGRKPTAVIKSGRTDGGRRAAQSHTGALAGADAVYDAAFAQCGALRAESLEDLMDLCKGMSMAQPLGEGRVAIITNSGGPGVLAADACERQGLLTPAPGPLLRARLQACLPAFAGLANPFDVTVEGDAGQYAAALEASLGEYDAAVVIYVGTPYLKALPIAQAVAEAAKAAGKPVTAYFEVGSDIEAAKACLEAAGVPCFASGEHAVRALAGKRKPPSFPVGSEGDIPQNKLGLSQVLEPDALNILQEMGIPTPPHAFVPSGEAAVEAAARIGYPVCLKVVSKDIIHKSDVGGVKLNLGDEGAVLGAFAALEAICAGKSFSGAMVYPMIKKGEELIMGLTRDPQFGPVAAFGMGGVFTEVFRDIALGIAPLTKEAALDMIRSIKAAPILEGARGQQKKDLDALADILMKLSRLPFVYDEIAEVDLNPVFAYSEGAAVADVRILLR